MASTAGIILAAGFSPAAANTALEFNGKVGIWCSIEGSAPSHPIEIRADRPTPIQIGQLSTKSNGAPMLAISQVIAVDADGAHQIIAADAILMRTAQRTSAFRQGSAQMRLKKRSEQFTITIQSARLIEGNYRFEIRALCF